ncbi:MAG: hypothetical protein NTW72_14310 [Gemmatimonadetes bacterium]|nr:hypothetical protein [Gemmatimonadota bacterium]
MILALAAALLLSAPPHNMHVAHTRLVVEGPVVMARVRMFRDDLQKALQRPVGDDSSSRAAVAAYVGRNFCVVANGARLTAEVLDEGADSEADQPIWWVLVQWKAAQPVKVLSLTVHLMFETFGDQQNIVQVSKQPGDHRQGLYFQVGDKSAQVLRF